MLFDHLSFSTHKTWEMNMKVPYAKALSSWESYFKATLQTLRQNATFAMKIGFLWPSCVDGPHQELPAGWLMQEKKQELTVNMQSAARAAAAEADDPTDYLYISPKGCRFTSLREALKHAKTFMHCLLAPAPRSTRHPAPPSSSPATTKTTCTEVPTTS